VVTHAYRPPRKTTTGSTVTRCVFSEWFQWRNISILLASHVLILDFFSFTVTNHISNNFILLFYRINIQVSALFSRTELIFRYVPCSVLQNKYPGSCLVLSYKINIQVPALLSRGEWIFRYMPRSVLQNKYPGTCLVLSYKINI